MAKEPSSTPDPKDEPKSQPPEQPAGETPSNVAPQNTSAPELRPTQAEKTDAPQGNATEIATSGQSSTTREQDSVAKAPTSPATSPATKAPAEQLAVGAPNLSGVLVREEIQSLRLIRVPEADFEEERSYQPTSYDLGRVPARRIASTMFRRYFSRPTLSK